MAQPSSDLPIDIPLSRSSTYPLFSQLFSVSSLRDLCVGKAIFTISEAGKRGCTGLGWMEDEGPGQRGLRLL